MITDRDECSVASLLSLDSYDSDGRIFVLRDGSVGLAWSLEPVEAELTDEGALMTLATRLDSLVRALPAGAAMQLLVESNRDVADPTQEWLDATTAKGLLSDLARARVEAIRCAEVLHEGRIFRARSIRLTLTVRLFAGLRPPGVLKTLRSALSGGDAMMDQYAALYPGLRRRLLDVANACESILIQAGIIHHRLDEHAVVALAMRLLNPGHVESTARCQSSGEAPLREQVARSPAFCDFTTGRFLLDGLHHAVLSAAALPRETWPGMLSRRGGNRPSALDLIEEGLVVFNVEISDPESVRRFLAAKRRLAFCQLSGGEGRVDVAAIRQETDQALAEMYVNGGRVVSARIHVVLRDADVSALDERAARAASAMSAAGLEMADDAALALSLFLQSMPFNYDPSNDKALKRGRRMFGINLAHLAPVCGSFRGTPTPDLILQNRSGEVVFFSPFDAETAPHMLLTGASGAGKSATANTMILSALRRGAQVFVLDRGASYRKVAELLGGTYVAFDPNAPVSLNPCGTTIDPEKQLLLVDIVDQMVTQGTRVLAVHERALVARAIVAAFDAANGCEGAMPRGHSPEVLMSDIQRELRAIAGEEPAAATLATCLDLFCGRGPHAGFFDRPCAINFNNPLTVFELGDMAKRRDVGPVLLMALIHNITTRCGAHRDRRKYLFVDEAWTLLKSDVTAGFLEEVLRTYRKLNTSAVLISQQPTDFAGPIGTALRSQAVNRLFLMQTADTIAALERALGLMPEEKDALGTLTTVKGRFAEMLITTPSARGVARLVPDPLSYWIMTSDPADNAHLNALVEKHRAAGDREPLRAALLEAAAGGRPGRDPAKEGLSSIAFPSDSVNVCTAKEEA